MFLRSLASGRGSFVKTVSVVPDGFEVAGRLDSELQQEIAQTIVLTTTQTPQFLLIHKNISALRRCEIYISLVFENYISSMK